MHALGDHAARAGDAADHRFRVAAGALVGDARPAAQVRPVLPAGGQEVRHEQGLAAAGPIAAPVAAPIAWAVAKSARDVREARKARQHDRGVGRRAFGGQAERQGRPGAAHHPDVPGAAPRQVGPPAVADP